jgi:dipeptidyl aminopeptidase/acylaminoacyl peptidase
MDADVPAAVTGMLVVADEGKAAYVPVQVESRVEIHRVALTGPELRLPVITGQRTATPLGCANGSLLFASTSLCQPTELFAVSLDGCGETQLTHVNDDVLSRISLPTAEHLWFESSDDVSVEGWFLKPPTGEPPYPTILFIHGGPWSGSGGAFHGDYHTFLGAGYGVLLVNHRGSTGRGDGFMKRIVGDWGHMEYEDLMAGVDHAVAIGLADPNRLGCCGTSGGGQLSAYAVGKTNRFKAAAPQNASINYVSFVGTSDVAAAVVPGLGGLPRETPEQYARSSPLTLAHRCRTPTLVLVHENDYRCPPEQLEQFYTALKAAGCTVEMVRFPGSPHGGARSGPPRVRRIHNEVLLDWMDRFVLGKQPDGGSRAVRDSSGSQRN